VSVVGNKPVSTFVKYSCASACIVEQGRTGAHVAASNAAPQLNTSKAIIGAYYTITVPTHTLCHVILALFY
jgi:hypothetical protein